MPNFSRKDYTKKSPATKVFDNSDDNYFPKVTYGITPHWLDIIHREGVSNKSIESVLRKQKMGIYPGAKIRGYIK